jgi:hypothetical protein
MHFGMEGLFHLSHGAAEGDGPATGEGLVDGESMALEPPGELLLIIERDSKVLPIAFWR